MLSTFRRLKPTILAAAPLLLLLLLALALRIHRLETQSLWNDEGNSLRLAQRSAHDLIDAAGQDIHPPGYYLALKGWIGLAGESEFSLRALSAFEGLLTVAAVAALGRALFSRAAGMLAGLLVALSPLAVYYSQETRMYAQLGLLAVLSMWLFVVWLRRAQMGRARRWALGLALCNAAGLYTQYSFPFTMLAQGALFAAWFVWRRRSNSTARRALIDYAALNGLTLALFLPWLPTAWDQITGWPHTGVDLALDEQLRTVFTWIVYGNTAGVISWPRFIWPGLLIGAALWPDRRAHRFPHSWRAGLPLAWAGIVTGALFVSGAYREANLKFLLPAQAAAALVMGHGARRLWVAQPGNNAILSQRKSAYICRLVAGISLFLVIIGQANALDALYTDPAYARADYRAITARITADPRPGDAIILDAPNQAEVFTYYYRGETPIYKLPRGLGGNDELTRADVLDVMTNHRRIFVLFWGEEERDPNRVVQATLDEHAYPVTSAWYGDVRLAVYSVLAEPPTAPQVRTDALFGDHILLDGTALSAERAQPGGVIGLTLFWHTDTPLDVRYKVAVQLLAPDGSLIAQHDAEPAGDRALTTTWMPGQAVIDSHGLVIPPDLPPGTYTIIVVLYDINAPAERLPVTVDGVAAGDHLALPPLEVH
ncbi:MAG: glycosyltransferase family 39 protein [Anaerolineae bacterium]|nr:glycosyltransferase family 39 protein [Anaerolineae bacterium]